MREPFVTNEFYHVYNRGVDKRDVFLDEYDYLRFLQSMDEFNTIIPIGSIFENSFIKKNPQLGNRTSKFQSPPLVRIVCYCLNTNHFHLILQQTTEKGISEYIKRLGGGYTKYFNNKYRRSGVLFQGKFKANHLSSNEYLLHLSAYVNLNNKFHTKTIDLRNKHRSSWYLYTQTEKKPVIPCSMHTILEQFKSKKEYKQFALETLANIKEKKQLDKELANLLLEN